MRKTVTSGWLWAILFSFLPMMMFAQLKPVTPTPPDFAYPKTVIANSEKDLRDAIGRKDDIAALRAMINMEMAQVMITTDSTGKALSMIEENSAKMTDTSVRALSDLLLADLYSRIYNADRWTYDQRQYPSQSNDCRFWSGEQFRTAVICYIDRSIRHPKALKQARIGDYSSIIEIPDGSATYYPTLYDFIGVKAIDLARGMSQLNNMLPASSLVLWTPGIPERAALPEMEKVLSIYGLLIDTHRNNPAPYINYQIDRLRFIADNLYNGDRSRFVDLLCDFYNEESGNEWSGNILLEIHNNIGIYKDNQRAKWLYGAIVQHRKRFRSYSYDNVLSNILAQMALPSAEIRSIGNESLRCVTAPGYQMTGVMTLRNIETASFDVYDVSSLAVRNDRYIHRNKAVKGRKVSSFELSTTGDVPFAEQVRFTLSLPTYGRYAIVPVNPKLVGKDNNSSCPVIVCTSLALYGYSFDRNEIVVVNPVSGKPVAGVDIMAAGYRKPTKKIGLTDSDGFSELNVDHRDWNPNLFPSKGNDKFSPTNYLYMESPDDEEDDYENLGLLGYTSLQLYHPGDTVNFASVLYSYNKKERKTVADHKLRFVLLDANQQKIDTLEATTDGFGRVSGQFVIPEGLLTGRFGIIVNDAESKTKNKAAIGRLYFTVSDYKLPEFSLTVDEAQMDVPSRGDVMVSGRVLTYSGFPLADCSIKATLSVGQRSPWWWWRAENPVQFFTKQLTTDVDGRFSLELGDSLLQASPLPDGLFTVDIQATSPSGESHDGTISFSRHNPYNITVELDKAINRDVPAKINVKVVDGKNMLVDKPVIVSFERDSVTALKRQLSLGEHMLSLSGLKSGVYTLKAVPDGFDADTVKVDEIVIYSPADKQSPVDALIWTPARTVTAHGDKAEILYATKADESYVLLLVNDDEKILRREWLHVGAGMHRQAVTLPTGDKELTVNMMVVNDLKSDRVTVTVKPDIKPRELEISLESFRDHVVPGSEERWTIRVKSTYSDTVSAAVIARMYNEALDQIEKSDWDTSLERDYNRKLSLFSPSFGLLGMCEFLGGRVNGPTYFTVPNLQWQTYGEELYPYWSKYRSIAMKLEGRAMGLSATSMENVEEDAVLYDVVEHRAPVMAEMKMAKSNSFDAGASVAEEEAVDAGNGGEVGSQPEQIPFAYRDSETPLAFFRPMLTTDKDGAAVLEFTVPNANTTWVFNAVAFTHDMTIAKKVEKTVANKPVMVSPNLPRFVRLGDRVAIRALVMNNSDTVQEITTHVELFNPADGKVITENDTVTTLAAGKSANVPIMLDATYGPLVGYRVKSSTTEFADGEQSLIGVLPSVTPVIESYPFYMVPDSMQYTFTMPQLPADARVDLQFCENPIWYVVKALPGLTKDEMSTPADAAGAIFSSAIAAGILHDNPEIADALEFWVKSDDKSDSMLASMLERNADLKMILLQATPWMLDAQSDTERMSRLSLLFDRKQISATQSKAIKLLEKLQTPDGGWRWIGQFDEPSLWATESALSLLGHLEWLGYMPKDSKLTRLVKDALTYADREEAKLFAKYPDADYLDYAFIRNRFKSVEMSTDVSRLMAATVQKAVAGWKKYSLFAKGQAVILLADNSYPSVARKIVKSLDQFAEVSPSKGMWWPSIQDSWYGAYNDLGITALLLEAYHRVEPQSPAVDRVRQWLILQKEARDWGTGLPITTVIADIIRTSGRWIAPAQGATVTLDGRSVVMSDVERYTGSFRADLSDMNPSGATLVIDKKADSPAWGAVMTRFVSGMTDVKAQGCDGVSIEKYVHGELKVGEKVTVELVIRTDREMDYVAVVDDRPACFESVEQLPQPVWSEGVCFYRENRNSATNIFISRLPKGVYRLSYDMWVNNAGQYTSGIATLQSQYAPQLTAHSSGTSLTVAE